MSRFSSVSLFDIPSDDCLSCLKDVARECASQSHHISVPHPAPIVGSISCLPGPSVACDGVPVLPELQTPLLPTATPLSDPPILSRTLFSDDVANRERLMILTGGDVTDNDDDDDNVAQNVEILSEESPCEKKSVEDASAAKQTGDSDSSNSVA